MRADANACFDVHTLLATLARFRDESFQWLFHSENRFGVHIIPLSDVKPEHLPKGFSLALTAWLNNGKSKESNWPRDLRNLRRNFNFLPMYIAPSKASKYKGVGSFLCKDFAHVERFYVSPVIGGAPCDFGVVLWTDSLISHAVTELDANGIPTHVGNDGGVLTQAESKYISLISTAGNILQTYGQTHGSDPSCVWFSFLVEYIWNHERPKVVSGFATVNEIGLVTARAIDRLLQDSSRAESSKDDAANKRKVEAKSDGLVSQGRLIWKGKEDPFIQPVPWRLLEFMWEKDEVEVRDAYRYAVDDHDKDETETAINSMIYKANKSLDAVEYERRLRKLKGVGKIVWR